MIRQAIFIHLQQSLDKGWIRIMIGWIVPCIILTVIYHQLGNHIASNNFIKAYNIDYLFIAAVVLLLFVNFTVEAFKWKVLCEPFENKPLCQYLKIILVGRSVNMITPFGIGDASARILMTQNELRWKSVASLVIARVTQFIPTFIFGSIATYFLIRKGVEVFNVKLSFILLTACFFIVMISLFISLNKKYLTKYLSVVVGLEAKLFFKALLLSFIRYFVFSCQFYLIFRSIGVSLELQYLSLGIFWVFFVKSVIPNLSIMGDLVKRELSSIVFFSLFDIDLGLIAIANLIIWFINIVLPSLLGSVFLSKFIKYK